jgi:tape measure domain-containing protein
MANDATLRVGADTRDAERALGRLQNALSAVATSAVISGFVKLSDQATELSNRLNQVTESATQNNIIFSRLVTIANSARTPLSQTGDLFFRIARSADQLGISQAQALQATETVAKAISASGISAAEAAGPLLQLGQALQSGRLQGDELRSILEGLPPVARALADSLGVPIGELKRLGAEGKLSSQAVIQAILAARDTVDRDFGKTVATVSQAFTVLVNNLTNLVKKFNDASGAGNTIAKAIGYISSAIVFLGDNIEIVKIAVDVLLFGVLLRGVLLAGKAIMSLGQAITGIAYFFRDAATKAGGFFTYVTTQFKSVVTQASGVAQPFANLLDRVFRPMALVLSTIVKYIGSIVKNFAPVIGTAVAAVTGLFDNLWDSVKNFLGIGGKPKDIIDPKKIEEAEKAINETNEGVKQITENQRKFREEMEKSLKSSELQLDLERQRSQLTPVEFALKKAIAEAEAKAAEAGDELTEDQKTRLIYTTKELAILQEQAKAYEELKKRREESLGAVTGALRSRDPRIAVDAEYQKRRQQIEDAYTIDSTISHETYLNALRALDEQYLLDKQRAELDAFQKKMDLMNAEKQAVIDRYELEKRQIDFVRKYDEIAATKKYKEMGFGTSEAEDAAKKEVEFKNKTEKEKTQFALEQANILFTELGKYNRAAFEASKALAIAQAIMNTYNAATKAFAMFGGFPFGAIAAAATVAVGMAQVAAIRSQQYSGRAIGGTVTGGTPYIVGENGPEIFQPQGSGRVVANNQLGGGTTNINFTIQAVDAAGVDQLLEQRRPMIVNMIRSAMNDRGNKATV